MAGHSKWANTKHKKARNDALRQKLWVKLLKEVTVAAKLGGDDASLNPRLRASVAKAKSNSVPIKNIESAILKGAGGGSQDNSEELIYEGYGVEGTAFIVQALSDNKARTAGDVRNIFNKNGGQLGESGSVAWGFKKEGKVVIPVDVCCEEELFEMVLEAGAEDLLKDPEVYEITCPPEAFGTVLNTVEEKEFEVLHAEIGYHPENRVAVTEEGVKTLQKMIEKFEELDDVQEVYHNIDDRQSETQE